MPRHRMRSVAGFTISLASCGGHHAPPSPGPGVAGYQGLTTCGGPVAPAAPAPTPPAPEIEPMPWSSAPAAAAARPAPREPEPSTDVLDVLDARFRDGAHKLRACAARHFARWPEDGTLRVETRFEVRADGRVAGAEVRGVDAALDRCVCDAITTIDFRGIGGRGIVRYPLIMAP